MKGIILVKVKVTRLYTISKSISKQLLCVFDKPMVYYTPANLISAGTPDSLLEDSNFIQTIEKRQVKKVTSIEEIAFNKGYINYEELNILTQFLHASEYAQYLLNLTRK